jgi:hypothetical protein
MVLLFVTAQIKTHAKVILFEDFLSVLLCIMGKRVTVYSLLLPKKKEKSSANPSPKGHIVLGDCCILLEEESEAKTRKKRRRRLFSLSHPETNIYSLRLCD